VMTVVVVHRLSPSLPPPRSGYAAPSGKWKFRLPPPRYVERGMAGGKDSILFQPHLTKLLLATLVQCTRGIQNNATVRFTVQSIILIVRMDSLTEPRTTIRVLPYHTGTRSHLNMAHRSSARKSLTVKVSLFVTRVLYARLTCRYIRVYIRAITSELYVQYIS